MPHSAQECARRASPKAVETVENEPEGHVRGVAPEVGFLTLASAPASMSSVAISVSPLLTWIGQTSPQTLDQHHATGRSRRAKGR